MPRGESIQQKLTRVRRPRVQISYEVFTNGAPVKRELPFVLGVLSDLSGDPETELKPLDEREFEDVDRDNFDTYMQSQKTRLVLRVKNKIPLSGEKEPRGEVGMILNFKTIRDFEPDKVAEMYEPTRKLLAARKLLAELKVKAVTNRKLEAVLRKVIAETEVLKKQVKSPGADSDGPAGDVGSER